MIQFMTDDEDDDDMWLFYAIMEICMYILYNTSKKHICILIRCTLYWIYGLDVYVWYSACILYWWFTRIKKMVLLNLRARVFLKLTWQFSWAFSKNPRNFLSHLINLHTWVFICRKNCVFFCKRCKFCMSF